MADELVNALGELVDLISAIDGLRDVPDNPPEAPRVYPFAPSSPSTGTWIKESSGQVKGLHKLRFGVYVQRRDLSRDYAVVQPYGDLVKDVLLNDSNSTWSGTIDQISGQIEYEFGEQMWGETVMIGWTFLVEVKIKSIWSTNKYVKG